MTREENLHWLNQEIQTWENECQSKHPIKESLYAARKALEQEPRWIPISEGLPKDIKPVQITWKNNEPATYYQDIKGKHFTGVAHYKDGKWYWYSNVTLDFLVEYGRCEIYEFDSAIEVVAWMPMPKPYETESEVDNGNDDGY